MTRVCDESGVVTPVTVIQAGPCTVMQVKEVETDGYHAVQLGFEDVKPHRSTKPLIGHAARAGTGPNQRQLSLGHVQRRLSRLYLGLQRVDRLRWRRHLGRGRRGSREQGRGGSSRAE